MISDALVQSGSLVMLRETLFGKAVITMHAKKARREQVSANVPPLFSQSKGGKCGGTMEWLVLDGTSQPMS